MNSNMVMEVTNSSSISFSDWKKQKDVQRSPRIPKSQPSNKESYQLPMYRLPQQSWGRPMPMIPSLPPLIDYPPIMGQAMQKNNFFIESESRNFRSMQPLPPSPHCLGHFERNLRKIQLNYKKFRPAQQRATQKLNFRNETNLNFEIPKSLPPKSATQRVITPPSVGLPAVGPALVRPSSPANINNINDKCDDGQKQFDPHNPQAEWIIKPQRPNTVYACTPEAKEEKQRLWREYRQAMKPFKNREFHNAKRVIQRLGKKALNELDEVDQGRLMRAREQVAVFKQMANERNVRWMLLQDEKKIEKEDTGSKTSTGSDAECTKAQIYVRKSNSFQLNTKGARGSRGGINNVVDSAPKKISPLWDNASNRAKLFAYSNYFVSGGHLHNNSPLTG